MDKLLFDIIFWIGFVGGGTVFVIFCVIMSVKEYRRNVAKKQEFEKSREELAEKEYATVTTQATVVDHTCCVRTIGNKTPRTVKEFVVVFQTENGNLLKMPVPEEMYEGFEKGQEGTLAIVDGELYGFEPI